jgi:hypothetical protein
MRHDLVVFAPDGLAVLAHVREQGGFLPFDDRRDVDVPPTQTIVMRAAARFVMSPTAADSPSR